MERIASIKVHDIPVNIAAHENRRKNLSKEAFILLYTCDSGGDGRSDGQGHKMQYQRETQDSTLYNASGLCVSLILNFHSQVWK